jgi:predicted dehydrogenase
VTRLGLVGAGGWGKRYLETIARRQDCRVTAVARQSGARWQDLLARAQQRELDGLIVATTPENQAEVAEATAGTVPLLVEKPLGLSASVASRLLASWRAVPTPAPVLVNFIHLWAPAYRALKSLVGGAHNVSSIASVGCSRGPIRPWSSLFDYGPHDAALCLDLLELAPCEVTSVRRAVGEEPQTELHDVQVRMGAADVHITVGNGAPRKRRWMQVVLRDGRTLVYDDLMDHPAKLQDRGVSVAVDRTMPLDAVLTDFLQQIALWRQGGSTADTATASLVLAVRVGLVLDAIAAA